MTIISRGRRVAAGPVAEVLAQHSDGGVRVRLDAVTDLPEAAERADRRAGRGSPPHPDHLVVAGVDKPAWITRMLAEQGLYVSELAPVTVDLESVFLELTATAPVPGQARQVDDSAVVGAGPAPGPAAPQAGPAGCGRVGSMSLTKAEVRRLFKRRLTRIVLILALLVLAAFPVGVLHREPQGQPRDAGRRRGRGAADLRAGLPRPRRRWSRSARPRRRAARTTTEQMYGPNCGKDWAPTRDQFRAEDFMPYEFNFQRGVPDLAVRLLRHPRPGRPS